MCPLVVRGENSSHSKMAAPMRGPYWGGMCVSSTSEEELQTDRKQHIKVRDIYLIYCEVASVGRHQTAAEQ